MENEIKVYESWEFRTTTEEFWEDVLIKVSRFIRGFLSKYHFPGLDVENVVGEALETILRLEYHLRFSDGHFWAMIMLKSRNIAFDCMRKHGRDNRFDHVRLEAPIGGEDSDSTSQFTFLDTLNDIDANAEKSTAELIDSIEYFLLNHLPNKRDADIWRSQQYYGLKLTEIADMYNVTVGNAGSILFQVKRALRLGLTKKGY